MPSSERKRCQAVGREEFDVCTGIHSALLKMVYMFILQRNSLKALKNALNFAAPLSTL